MAVAAASVAAAALATGATGDGDAAAADSSGAPPALCATDSQWSLRRAQDARSVHKPARSLVTHMVVMVFVVAVVVVFLTFLYKLPT